MTTTVNHVFGQTLRTLRTARKFTQDSLAYTAGLDRTFISLLELGQRGPSLTTMLALCRALDISLTDMASAIDATLTRVGDE
jgi:transcriptional regulator with XRE-family HTH domain